MAPRRSYRPGAASLLTTPAVFRKRLRRDPSPEDKGPPGWRAQEGSQKELLLCLPSAYVAPDADAPERWAVADPPQPTDVAEHEEDAFQDRLPRRGRHSPAAILAREEADAALPEEELGSEDEPPEQAILTPEEQQAKRDIWNHHNKDLLELWHHQKIRKNERKRKQEDANEKKARREAAQKSARLRRLRELTSPQGGRLSRSQVRKADEDVDDDVFDFWTAEAKQAEAAEAKARAEKQAREEAAKAEAAAKWEAENPELASAQAAAQIVEDREQELRECAARRRFKQIADTLNDLLT